MSDTDPIVTADRTDRLRKALAQDAAESGVEIPADAQPETPAPAPAPTIKVGGREFTEEQLQQQLQLANTAAVLQDQLKDLTGAEHAQAKALIQLVNQLEPEDQAVLSDFLSNPTDFRRRIGGGQRKPKTKSDDVLDDIDDAAHGRQPVEADIRNHPEFRAMADTVERMKRYIDADATTKMASMREQQIEAELNKRTEIKQDPRASAWFRQSLRDATVARPGTKVEDLAAEYASLIAVRPSHPNFATPASAVAAGPGASPTGRKMNRGDLRNGGIAKVVAANLGRALAADLRGI